MESNEDKSIYISFLEDALGYNIYRTDLLFRRELIHSLSIYGLTPEQWHVLVVLWHTGQPINQSRIVETLLKDKHTVSRIIQRLERDGWIKKSNDPNDARSMIIYLTEKGKSLKDEVPKKLTSHFNTVLKDISSKEIDGLITSLKNLRGILGDECIK